MSDWTTALVVRDRDGSLWGRERSGWTMLHSTWGTVGRAGSNATLLAAFGPLTPVLDADGLPVVRTVGDLTARHIGRQVRVETAGIETAGEMTGVFGTCARPVSLHVEDRDRGVLWIVGPEMGANLDTPCELLP